VSAQAGAQQTLRTERVRAPIGPWRAVEQSDESWTIFDEREEERLRSSLRARICNIPAGPLAEQRGRLAGAAPTLLNALDQALELISDLEEAGLKLTAEQLAKVAEFERAIDGAIGERGQ
jgi:hypothetical protein